MYLTKVLNLFQHRAYRTSFANRICKSDALAGFVGIPLMLEPGKMRRLGVGSWIMDFAQIQQNIIISYIKVQMWKDGIDYIL